MKKAFIILCASLFVTSSVVLTSCDPATDDGSTAAIVEKASKMTLEELEAASKTEMEASTSTFKVVGLTSTLAKALTKFCDTYDWMEYDVNTFVNNSYKDYALLTALEQADDSYFADFALVQDARSLADYLEAGITINYIPSDYETLNLPEENTYPLKGLYFNKIFFSNERLGVNLNNIWQLAGSATDANHLDNLSFQTPITEQINMSFILSLYDEANQARLETAYQNYYGTAWAASDDYSSCGEQFVHEFVANISKWHSSDGTAMKKTQYEETAQEGVDPFIYYGAFAKMKDAAGQTYGEETAMVTVDWDKTIDGFNGFMYAMYSQIIKNAEHPYTACLYARFLLTPECYQAMCYNSSTPNSLGDAANMYGYYYPCTSTTVGINDNDWTKAQWIEKSINEDFDYLSTVKGARINEILALVSSNTKAS
ncbi:MAG: hypothetical protein WC344_02980 [Bacilli bacterium]|jgi:ABC-type Fe3+ transport system substrate-binding protein